MKFPKKLIAFGLSLCMSIVPCGPVAAEDFTDAQTDMTDTIDTFTDDGNSEESERYGKNSNAEIVESLMFR